VAEVASAGKLLPIAAARHEVHIFYYSFVENGEDMRTAATVFGCYLLAYVFAAWASSIQDRDQQLREDSQIEGSIVVCPATRPSPYQQPHAYGCADDRFLAHCEHEGENAYCTD